MAQYTSKAQDSAVPDSSAAIALAGSQIVAMEHALLFDAFEATTVDTDKWTAGTGSGGTVTQSSGITLNTSTNTAGSASILSVPTAVFLPYAEMTFKAHLRFGTALVADCAREMTLKVDASNYAQFLGTGTSWVARVYAGGAEFAADTPISLPNAGDLSYMDLEMRVHPEAVYFIANGVQVASYSSRGKVSRLWQSGVLGQAFFKAINSGSAVANTMEIRTMSLTRRFNAFPGVVRAKKMTADGIVARGPCWYLGCRRISGTTNSAIIYDGTDAGGTIIDQIAAAGDAPPGLMPGAIECINGIYVDLTTDALMVYYIS